MLDSAPADTNGGTRAGNVRHRETELARAARKPSHGLADVLHPPERMEQVVELLGVSELFAFAGLGPDLVEAGQRIRLAERQIHIEEGIALPSASAASPRWCKLTGICA